MSNWPRLRMVGLLCGGGLLLVAGHVQAGDQILRGEVPAWVVPTADTSASAVPTTTDGLRVLLFDTQYRSEGEAQSGYVHVRRQAQTPQALPLLGNVALIWSPSSQDVTVHKVQILRDGEVLDVLADQSFETLRREQNLEQAMLDGQLTAVLQPAGLRVGDILDVAYTLVSRDPVTKGHAEQLLDLNMPVAVDRFHYRASWPRSQAIRLRAANNWTPLNVQQNDGYAFVEIALQDAQPIPVPADAPVRLQSVRRIELSDYRDWSDIAVTLKPLYDQARRPSPDSPLLAEIERIRALSGDPAVRAAAALRLVQDQIRYVALVMGEGALTPATADETWLRRLGDCKAKTALLLALLDGLGIEAAPAAVSIANGDGMNDRLPMLSAFDHVLVRAVVDGKVFWLDGTRTGDRALADLAVPGFGWALPLTGKAARLERLEVQPLSSPTLETRYAFDASTGLYAPAGVEAELIFRGDAAAAFGADLSVLSGAQKDQALRALWQAQIADLTIAEVGSSYDVETNVGRLTMKGSATLDWSADGLIPPGSTYARVSTEPRPEGPFRSAPFAVIHPTYTRQKVTLRLPEDGQGFRTSGGQVELVELGHRLRRTVGLEGDLLSVEIDRQSLEAEVTAAEADRARIAEKARPYDPPRIFPPKNYRPTEGDRASLAEATPSTAGGWLDRAWALSKVEEYAGAAEAAAQAIALEPENSSAWANRGVYRLHAGDREGAVADLEKAVDLDPSERIAMNGNALIAIEEGRYEDAVIELSRALRQAPGDEFALSWRGQSYVALKQFDRALRDFDALAAAHGDNSEIKLMRIGALEDAGRTDQAGAEFAALIAANADDLSLKLQRIGFLNRVGRNAQAEAEMDALAAAMPEDRKVLLNQAVLKLEHEQPQTAMELFDRVLPLYADNPKSVLLYRAEAAIALDRLDLATRDFAQIREGAKDDADGLNNLCWTAATAGVLLEQALKDCDAALLIKPNARHILDSRGRVLLQLGDAAAALKAYDAVLAMAPNHAGSRYGRGLALEALGRLDEGRSEKAVAMERQPDVVEDFESYVASASSSKP